jgi:hypothetical protein
MKKIIYHLILILLSLHVYSQCKVETTTRADGVIRYLRPELIGSGTNCELGLSVYTNGATYFLATTVRYFSTPQKTVGTLRVALTNKQSLELKLYTCELISDVELGTVPMGLFYLTKLDIAKLKQANIYMIVFKDESGVNKIVSASTNSDVAKRQINCLQSNSKSTENNSKVENKTKMSNVSEQEITPIPKWIEKKGEIGNFYLSFPNAPTYSEMGGSTYGWTAKDKDEQVTYLLSYIEAPSDEEVSMASVEKYLLPSLMKGDIEVSKSYLSFKGSNAMDFLYKTIRTPEMYKKGRVVIHNHNIYVLQVIYYFSKYADFDRFAKSLKFY